MECLCRIITIILVFEFTLCVEYQARYWPSKFYKKVLILSPGAWRFKRPGFDPHSDCKLISYAPKITFQLSFPMAQELYANSVFYRNKHRYTVVRSQPNWAIWPKSHLLHQIIDTWSSRMNLKLFWLFFAQKIL